MPILHIAEPGAAAAPVGRRKVGIGIDLGTTNSLVAHYNGSSLSVFADLAGQRLLPSVVWYSDAGEQVGAEAVAAASAHPDSVIASAKRFMGRSRDEVCDDGHLRFSEGDTLAFATRQGPRTPVEVSAAILKVLRSRAQSALGDAVDGAVITVPAYFDDGQRQATRQAAELAGLRVLRLLNEPTAAAIAYGLDSEEEGVIAVYDLGGGTFDVSILRLHQGVFEVLATGGDSALGGDDFDRVMAARLQASLPSAPDPSQRRRLLALARCAKEALTEATTTVVDLSELGGDQISVSRQQFEADSADLLERTLVACRRCLDDAGVRRVDRAVLVGGSTRMPMISTAVEACFGVTPLCSLDPDEVVAMGAARQADVLVGNRGADDPLLLDVIPLSLGLETYGGLVERIIPRNTTLPVARAQEFTTARDGQTGLVVHVVQGERERVEDCRSLARFELAGIPAMVAGAARILVSFQVDADGLLEVSAREESTGTATRVTVKPAFGLAEEEVAAMLRASYEHAAEDVQARQLTEARVEAEQLLAGIAAALAADGDLLEPDERAELDAAVVALSEAAADDCTDTVRSAIERAGQASETFAARRMDRSIRTALGGRKLAEFEEETG